MKNNKKILFLYIIFFMQGIVTNIHHPLTPYYVEFLNLKNYMVGLFFAFMNLGIMIGGPFWGNLGDKGKQRSVIFIGLLMYALGQTLFGFGHIFNPLVLSFFRLFSGFGIAAATTVIMSEIILLSDKSVRSRNIAYAVAILALGGAIGYYIGGQIHTNLFFIDLLKTDKFHNALLLQGISISIVATIFYLFYRSENIKTNENKQRSYFWEGFKEIKYIKKSLLFFLISLTLITISQTNVDKYLELYFKDLGYKANTLGNFKMIVGLITIVATFTIVPLIMRVEKDCYYQQSYKRLVQLLYL